MTDQEQDKRAPGSGDSNETEAPADFPSAPGNDEAAPSEADVLLRLAAENEELKDRALRLAAEMDNLRKRTARDVVEARSYGIANFARDMLTVSDNLRRALEAVPAGAAEGVWNLA